VIIYLSELCGMPLDLVIVVDKSDYWQGQLASLLQGVGTLATRLSVGVNFTHIAFVTYAETATLHFNLVRYFQSSQMQSEITRIRQDDSGTATHLVSHSNIQPLLLLQV